MSAQEPAEEELTALARWALDSLGLDEAARCGPTLEVARGLARCLYWLGYQRADLSVVIQFAQQQQQRKHSFTGWWEIRWLWGEQFPSRLAQARAAFPRQTTAGHPAGQLY